MKLKLVNPNHNTGWVWFPAITKWHDQTGTAHILNEKGKAVCGGRTYAFGGGSQNIAYTGARKCRSCEKFAQRRSKP